VPLDHRLVSEFEAAFEMAPIGMALLDAKACVLRANRALCEMLGCAATQLHQVCLRDLTHPDDVAADEAARAELIAGTRDSYEGERRYVHTDGHVVWGYLACSLVRDSQGEPSRFIVQLQDVTERILVERMLRQSEERFRSLTMLSSDWYWEQDEQFRYVSSVGSENGGWRPDFYRGGPEHVAESIGKRRWEQEGVTPLAGSWDDHRATVEAHLPFRDFEYSRRKPGERPRFISASGEPVFDSRGRFTGYRGTARDITATKLAQQRLHEAQSLLHMAAQIGRLGAWAFDVRTDRLTWSEEVCAMHEVPQTLSMKGSDALLFYCDGYRQTMEKLFRTCMADGTPFDVEAQALTARGRPFWMRVICEAEWDARGKVVRLLGACQDISDSKSATEEVYALAQQLHTTLETMGDAFFTLDRDWRFTYLNAEAERLMRRPRRELLGKRIGEEFKEIRNSAIAAHYERAMNENVPVQFDQYYEPFDLWAQLKIYPSPQGLTVHARDVTEYKRAREEVLRLNAELEERVRQRTAQLRQANRELESFSYSIAHDLRAPLGSIDGFSHVLEQAVGDSLGEAPRHYLRRVRAGVRQMAELTDGLLALSNLSHAEVSIKACDLAAIASNVVAGLRERHPERVVEVAIESPLPVLGDARLLSQLVASLLGNAWKFTSMRDTATISLTRSQQPGGPDVFTVRDNGTGFDMAHASRLFRAFHRMHTPAEFEGNGIGLAMVQKIVSRHGGQVWAESAPGQGAAFHFTLAPDRM
jgi:PAS domain S-box-containing protein